MAREIVVRGQKETAAALSKVSDDLDDLSDANKQVARDLLPGIIHKTRVDTGALAAGWGAGPQATRIEFTNPLPYALTQEFGNTRGVEPTFAIEQTFREHEGDVERAYGSAIERRGKRRGFRTTRCKG